MTTYTETDEVTLSATKAEQEAIWRYTEALANAAVEWRKLALLGWFLFFCACMWILGGKA